MSVATTTAIGIAAGVGAAGAIGGAAISSNAAGNAAQTQSDAANYAANLQHQDAEQALQFQQKEWQTQQQNEAPWLNAGKGALGSLQQLLQTPGYQQGWTQQFQAPTAATEQNDPGYQFRLQQGMDAMQNSASAKGGLLSGNTAEALQNYAQNYASNEYGNVYNRALGQYQQNYNIFQQNQANQYNRLAALSGVGQTSANQLGQQGQATSGNIANILLGSGQQIGQDVQNAAAARASGDIGSANAFGGALGGIGGNLSSLLLMNQLFGQNGGYSNQQLANQYANSPYADVGSLIPLSTYGGA